MPMNNNQKVQSAAARLLQLPVLRSACAGLSVLYADAKCRHAGLRSVCEGLESSVTALASPVLVKLEAHVSIANDAACKSLDWLETTFPVIHAPTEQVVAAAMNKMNEIQDALSAAANVTVGWTQPTVTWLMGRIPQRAVSVAGMGLNSALDVSEALMDRVLPPTEEDEEEAHLLEGFEAATLRRSYPARLLSLASKLCRRTYHVIGSRMQSVQVSEHLSRSGLVRDLQSLPQYVQHQLVSVLFFVSHIYNLSCPPSRHHQSDRDKSRLSASEVQVHPHSMPSACRIRRPAKTSVFDNGCHVKGCVGR